LNVTFRRHGVGSPHTEQEGPRPFINQPAKYPGSFATRAWWCTPVISATWDTAAAGSGDQGQLGNVARSCLKSKTQTDRETEKGKEGRREGGRGGEAHRAPSIMGEAAVHVACGLCRQGASAGNS
jgi:hypothetical protein